MNANLKVDASPTQRASASVDWTGRHLPLLRGGFVAAIAIVVVAMAGCTGSGDGLAREAVAGQITLDGRPLTQGLIQFVPDDPGVATPTHVGTIINAGRYDIARTEGPIPGRYKVAISSGSVAPASEPEEDLPGIAKRGKPPRDLIPATYNVTTTLQAVVKAGQENTFDFELASK